MWTTRVLSIIVKNVQSYIVAVVWGAAEVLSLCKGKGDKSTAFENKSNGYENKSSDKSSVSVAPSE